MINHILKTLEISFKEQIEKLDNATFDLYCYIEPGASTILQEGLKVIKKYENEILFKINNKIFFETKVKKEIMNNIIKDLNIRYEDNQNKFIILEKRENLNNKCYYKIYKEDNLDFINFFIILTKQILCFKIELDEDYKLIIKLDDYDLFQKHNLQL